MHYAFIAVLALFALPVAPPGIAGPRDDTAGLEDGVVALHDQTGSMLADLPERKLAELRRAPRAFVEAAADLIYGFGENGALGPAGLDRFIAMRRALVRGREMRRFMLVDLDDDAVVTQAEIGVLIAAEAATSRGRLFLAFRSADRAGGRADGRVDLAEMRAHASDVALTEIDAGDVDRIRSILVFDLDGNGRVTLDEVTDGVEALTGPV